MAKFEINHPIRRGRRIVPIGDLNERINLQSNVLKTQFQTGNKDLTTFQTFARPWACVKTNYGSRFFDGVEMEDRPTHRFYIRYRNDLNDSTITVEYKSQRYEILDVENLDEKNEFLCLHCRVSGTNELRNQATWGG